MRPPEVFVRELWPEEAARLKSTSKRAQYQSKRQRAMILLRVRPDTQGVALTRWSLPKLAAHLALVGIVLSAQKIR